VKAPEGLLPRLAEIGMDRGWTGVQLFFVLSGFLITGILLDTKEAPNHYRSFFARRALRIFPVYYLTLLVVLVLLPLFGVKKYVPGLSLEEQLPFWLYYANWVAPFGPPQYALSHLWSLAIEEQFYWIWPFVLHRLSIRQVLWVCIAVAVVSLLIRLGMLASHVSSDAIYKFSVCRMDALALGSAAAAAIRLPAVSLSLSRRRGLLLAVAGALALMGLIVTRGYGQFEPMTQGLGYSVLSLVFAVIVYLAADSDINRDHALARGLRFAPLRMLGKYSYGIYVFHWPLHEFLGRRVVVALDLQGASTILPSLVYITGCGGAALLLAMVSYHWFESPILGLKRHFEAQPAPRDTIRE
jgi:peptidoglycan/LPS O-acetylase OafA/YrhL